VFWSFVFQNDRKNEANAMNPGNQKVRIN